MKVYKNLNIENKFKNSVIAIGNFDGVHTGHQKVLKQAKKLAKKNKLKVGLLSFEPIPRMFFNKNFKNFRINSLEQKNFYLKKNNLDFFIIKNFNKKFSQIDYRNFIKEIIFKKLKCKFIFVSKNFKFGKNRSGDVKKLKLFEKQFNYETLIVPPVKKNKKVLSSTIVRKLISEGRVSEVEGILGRPWSIIGKVNKGMKRGRTIGFPTCNISIRDYVLPKLGVYSVKIKGSTFFRKGIANVGYRPTFNGKKILLEVNIFGLSKNLYNKELEIFFYNFIRPEKKFKNLNELKNQINIDIKNSKK